MALIVAPGTGFIFFCKVLEAEALCFFGELTAPLTTDGEPAELFLREFRFTQADFLAGFEGCVPVQAIDLAKRVEIDSLLFGNLLQRVLFVGSIYSRHEIPGGLGIGCGNRMDRLLDGRPHRLGRPGRSFSAHQPFILSRLNPCVGFQAIELAQRFDINPVTLRHLLQRVSPMDGVSAG